MNGLIIPAHIVEAMRPFVFFNEEHVAAYRISDEFIGDPDDSAVKTTRRTVITVSLMVPGVGPIEITLKKG